MTVLKGSGLSCPAASRAFRQFLEDTSGVLPRPWTINPINGTFKRGTTAGLPGQACDA